MENLISYIIKNTDTMNINSIYYGDFMEADPVVPLSFDNIIDKISLKDFYENIISNKKFSMDSITTIDGVYYLPYNIAITLMYYRDYLLSSWMNIHLKNNNNNLNKNKYETVAKILSDKFTDIIKFYHDEFHKYVGDNN